ncbi:hypothetical protein IWW57_005879, partial [Coemansia sp. S610]
WPGDDTATCAFCGYALAEWEAEDEPNVEHARRAPDCLFFKLELDEVPSVQPSPQPRRVSVHASRPSGSDSDSSKRPRLSTNAHDPVQEEACHSEAEAEKVPKVEAEQEVVEEEAPAELLVAEEHPPLVSPTEMNVDDEPNAASQIDTQGTTQVDGSVDEPEEVGEAWELTEEEERMTVEEFIRACCDHKIASLEASAAQMVSEFMQRAESTRERIQDMTW